MNEAQITKERRKKLAALAKLMTKQSRRFMPVTGELINCFDLVLSTEETDFLISMGTDMLTYEEVEALFKPVGNGSKEIFDKLLGKGLIKIYYDNNGKEFYQLPGIVVGWFEKYLSSGQFTAEKKEFGRRFSEYLNSFYRLNRIPLRSAVNLQTRFMPAYNSISAIPAGIKTKTVSLGTQVNIPEKEVMPCDNIDTLIEKYGADGRIAVSNCFCRRIRESVDEKCLFDQDEERCLGLGAQADYVVRCGIGRYISKEQAIEIIHKTEQKGAVHTIMHHRDEVNNEEIEICNCCWDCCGILGTYNRGILALSLKSYYIAGIKNSENCIGCGDCSKYCPSAAITSINGKAEIDTKRCIGCGQCAFQCQYDVIELTAMERRVDLPMLKPAEVRVHLQQKTELNKNV